jgi:hypothetical protein
LKNKNTFFVLAGVSREKLRAGQALSVGVWTKDGLSGNHFLLKVYLCGVLGDMLGSAKLSKMAGHMALHGCHFCTVWGACPSSKKGMI